MSRLKAWVEAMRLRTLPVSVAGVAAGASCALVYGAAFRWLPLLLCTLFALLAQVASNFANEYYDYRDGLDRPGREGPRRGVTEGDITPGAMKAATWITLGAACAVGCGLIVWGGWWLVAVGAAIALSALGYSAGPYPLSRHGMGEVAVILFFGLVPVCLTYWLVSGDAAGWQVWLTGLGMGLLGANVLLVNNIRDIPDDEAVGKKTLAVRYGPLFALRLYAFFGVAGTACTLPLWWAISPYALLLPLVYYTGMLLPLARRVWYATGRALNPLLGATARAMALYAFTMLVGAIARIF